jgi:hypothetical protein
VFREVTREVWLMPTDYTVRLATRIRATTNRRLRLAAAVEGQHIGELLDGVLDRHLPSDAELAAQISGRGAAADADTA